MKVFSDIIDAIDKGKLALLSLLDLSAAFDTVDHHILRQRMQRSFGVDGIAIQWFDSYLTERTQSVCLADEMNASRKLVCGVLQGSVLKPLLFILYTADIVLLIHTMVCFTIIMQMTHRYTFSVSKPNAAHLSPRSLRVSPALYLRLDEV